MRTRRERRRNLSANNLQRQSQALSILTIGTIIFAGALFQVDLTINSLTPRELNAASIQFMLVLLTAIAYINLVDGTSRILTQATPIRGHDLANKLVNPLLIVIGLTIGVFIAGTLASPPPYST